MKKIILSLLILFTLTLSETATAQTNKQAKVKNVIFLIGDGMGVTQVAAAMLAQGAPLSLERAQIVGLQKTHSSDSEVTDSAASGTALATGHKTYNSAIGVDVDKQPIQSIRARAQKEGFATGVVATYSVTNATPAAFVAHQDSRYKENEIAEDYLNEDIDLFFGGGLTFFEKRADGRNISDEMRKKGFEIVYSLDNIKKLESGKVGALLADNAMKTMINGRGNYLPEATAQALKILSKNSKKGFFVMVEGSQIDGGGHDNNIEKVVTETVDFDNAVKVAFDFADSHPGTLVVVTADHETGGLTLPTGEGDKSKTAVSEFSTKGHTGVMVPIYAYGTGASEFSGIMENTDIPKRIAKLMGLK